MKRKLGLLFASALTLSACTPAQETGMTAGTYEGSAMGMKGQVKVSVTVDETSIQSIEVLETVDTPVISDAAIDVLPAEIVKTQNIQVDNVTGATMTSLGIKSAVANAIEAAGGDLSQFRKEVEEVTLVEKETEDYDIVIVGSGMAGLSAAIKAARESEASVLVLEKLAYTGGSARVCGGGIWAVNSPINDKIGQDSTVEEYISFMKNNSENEDLDTELMTNIYNMSSDVITYYYDNGLPVSLDTWTLGNPNSQLPVLWADNGSETDWETGDSGFMDAITTMAEDLDIDIRLLSEVTELVVEDNKVTGVKVEDQDSYYTVNAKQVILATGGFTRNAELIDTYAEDYSDAFAFTNAGSTGDGFTLTEDLDTVVVGDGMMGLFGVNPNYGYYGSLGNLVWLPQMYVNAEGEKFGMETAFYGDTLKLLLEQTGSCGYAIFDSTTTVTERLEDAVENKVAYKYDSLEDLANDRGIDAENLAATAKEHGLAEGPYYCVTVRPLFIGSIPGLDVDEDCHVLNSNGEVIEGLLACGELTFGNVFTRAYPASGTGVATSAYTGAIAGNTAVDALGNN